MEEKSFYEQVYEVADLIPKGRVTTYGMIAEYLGSKGSARMVGWALNRCGGRVPAHRVVNKQGLLTGKMHFGDIFAMESLLEEEGIEVKDNQIQNLAELLWNPNEELL